MAGPIIDPAAAVAARGREVGCAGTVLTGTKFETVVDEGARWRRTVLSRGV